MGVVKVGWEIGGVKSSGDKVLVQNDEYKNGDKGVDEGDTGVGLNLWSMVRAIRGLIKVIKGLIRVIRGLN